MNLPKDTQVLMKPRMAKWHIENIEIYEYNGSDLTEDISDFDIEIQIFLTCLLGEPIKGMIKTQGVDSNTYGIIFWCDGLSMFTYVDRKDFELLDKKCPNAR